MARKSARPGRTLGAFFIGLAIAYGLVALVGTWKPALGLDLEGGTRITLIATGNNITPENMKEAASIIDSRVNGSGVSEAEVTTQGGNHIVVEVPGDSRRDLLQTVERQAQLRFRVVACSSQDPTCGGGSSTTPPPTGTTAPPTIAPTGQPSSQPSSKPSSKSGSKSGSKSSGKNRAPILMDKKKATQSPSPSPSSETKPPKPIDYTDAEMKAIDDPLTWMDNPDAKSVAAYNKYTCPTNAPVDDNPNVPLVTCGPGGEKFLLSKAVIEGTDLTAAQAQLPQNQVSWEVQLTLKNPGKSEFTKISQQFYGTQKRFAVVLDGKVLSAPIFTGVITGGTSQITGSFSQEEAQSLATSLKFGALPIAFDKSPNIETIGPSLAGDQLNAGLKAGIIGLIAVMLYCLFYYRGLGLVVIASLLVAAATTYAVVLLLAKSAGFTLTLPGIAGLIVAVGITADSFIVFFERIRDEMRDGKSMRVAVEAGWVRARNTCVAADSVSILAAVVLYIFAAGVVKGFAFALGVSTLIDLVVFFWFTHPMVSLLARRPFFNQGHKLSGLDAENLGVDRIATGGAA